MTDLKYTANFCEENIWHLCQHPELSDFDKQVVFISSLSRNTPLQYQKSAQNGLPVWWDYHVILMTSKNSKHLIYDFDTTLPFPSKASEYLSKTFQDVTGMKSQDYPLFKIIRATEYVEQFHSDRLHMIDQSGNWIFEPPQWPAIKSGGSLSLSTLMDFSDASSTPIFELNDLMAKMS
ncbi:MAG: hypothetical protein AAGC88_05175 [Bacteroidota bacterium]